MNIARPSLNSRVTDALHRSRAVGLVGPRQCGKSTLARHIAKYQSVPVTFFDLEDPTDEARLRDPKLALERLRGLIVIDEVQRRPDLMPTLRVLLDRDPSPARFLLLGSASPQFIRGASESLAGRIEFVEMRGFALDEVGTPQMNRLWLRGGFPLSTLATSDKNSMAWRTAFLHALTERDLGLIGVDLPSRAVHRLLTMLAHYHGQTWNGSEIGRSMQLAHTTVKRYLDLLAGALLVRTLPPWFEDVGKRLVKAPKIYIRDSGLLHSLLGLTTQSDLESHPKLGASWEGFALETALAWCGDQHAYFWATHAGAELDLCVIKGPRRIGMEFKYTSVPSTTKSMRVAMQDLKLDHLYVVYPGEKNFPLDETITACGLPDLEPLLRAWS